MKDSFNNLNYKELVVKRDDLRKRHFDLRMQRVQGRLENPLELRIIRKKLARLNTLIHEYALGIREELRKQGEGKS